MGKVVVVDFVWVDGVGWVLYLEFFYSYDMNE